MNTEQTAHDIDLLRELLDQPKISWLGYSGGTWLGAYYATYFPDRVDRFVLDSNVDFTTDWQSSFRWQPLGFERRFRVDFATWAAVHNPTLGLGGTAEDVRGFYDRLRADLSRSPMDERVLFGLPITMTIDAVSLDAGVSGAMYSKDIFPPLAEALLHLRKAWDAAHAPATTTPPAASSRVQQLLAGIDRERSGGTRRIGFDAMWSTFYAITCNDTPWNRSREYWQRQAAELGRDYPLTGWYTVINPCAVWPRAEVDLPKVTGKGIPPVLMVQSEHDPATPVEGARLAHKGFAGSRMVTVAGEGDHGIYNGGNLCVDGLVERFLIGGELPETDSTCAGVPIPLPGNPAGGKAPTENATDNAVGDAAVDIAPRNPLLRNRWTHERLESTITL